MGKCYKGLVFFYIIFVVDSGAMDPESIAQLYEQESPRMDHSCGGQPFSSAVLDVKEIFDFFAPDLQHNRSTAQGELCISGDVQSYGVSNGAVGHPYDDSHCCLPFSVGDRAKIDFKMQSLPAWVLKAVPTVQTPWSAQWLHVLGQPLPKSQPVFLRDRNPAEILVAFDVSIWALKHCIPAHAASIDELRCIMYYFYTEAMQRGLLYLWQHPGDLESLDFYEHDDGKRPPAAIQSHLAGKQPGELIEYFDKEISVLKRYAPQCNCTIERVQYIMHLFFKEALQRGVLLYWPCREDKSTTSGSTECSGALCKLSAQASSVLAGTYEELDATDQRIGTKKRLLDCVQYHVTKRERR